MANVSALTLSLQKVGRLSFSQIHIFPFLVLYVQVVLQQHSLQLLRCTVKRFVHDWLVVRHNIDILSAIICG